MYSVHSVLDKDKDKAKKTTTLTLAMTGQKLFLPDLRNKDDDKKKKGDFIQLIFKLPEKNHFHYKFSPCLGGRILS